MHQAHRWEGELQGAGDAAAAGGAEGDAVAPGAKVLLAGAAVKAGIVLVDSRSLKVLLPPPYAQEYSLL